MKRKNILANVISGLTNLNEWNSLDVSFKTVYFVTLIDSFQIVIKRKWSALGYKLALRGLRLLPWSRRLRIPLPCLRSVLTREVVRSLPTTYKGLTPPIAKVFSVYPELEDISTSHHLPFTSKSLVAHDAGGWDCVEVLNNSSRLLVVSMMR